MDATEETFGVLIISKPNSEESKEVLRGLVETIKSSRQDFQQSSDEDSLLCSRCGSLQKIKKFGAVLHSIEDYRLS